MEFQNLIERLGIAGYHKIEPPLLVAWAMGWPLILTGRPGTAKTKLSMLLSSAEHGTDEARLFDCPKENILTIAGLPDLEKMKEGIFAFIQKMPDGKPSPFIHAKRHLVFNEINRTNSESQNLLLEPLQERTFFGQPLPIARQSDPELIDYSIISTQNPEGLGVKRVDAALDDRFYMVIPVPDAQAPIGQETRMGIVGANIFQFSAQAQGSDGRDEVLSAFAQQLRREYKHLLHDQNIVQPILKYGVYLWEVFFEAQKDVTYVSPRRQAMITEMVLGMVAYKRLVGDFDKKGAVDLKEAAEVALLYGVEVPLKMSKEQTEVLKRAHEKASNFLKEQTLSEMDAFMAELIMRPNLSDKIRYILANLDTFRGKLSVADREQIVGEITKNSQGTDVLDIYELLARIGGHEEQARKLLVKIVTQTSQAIFAMQKSLQFIPIYSFDDQEIYKQFGHLTRLIGQGGTNHPQVIRRLLEPSSASVDVRVAELISLIERTRAKGKNGKAKVAAA